MSQAGAVRFLNDLAVVLALADVPQVNAERALDLLRVLLGRDGAPEIRYPAPERDERTS